MMEYVISNKPMRDGIKIGDLYWRGDYKRLGNFMGAYEGQFYFKGKRKNLLFNNIQELMQEDIAGIYNVILYDEEAGILVIRNDKLGKLPMYIYHKNSEFIITNMFWNIPEMVSFVDLGFEPKRCRKSIFFRSSLKEDGTYFRSVTTVPYATILTINLKTKEFLVKKTWDYKLSTNETLTREDAFTDFDREVRAYFTYLKTSEKGPFLVGNSGGLDSRLILLYALENDLRLVPYATVEKKSYFGLSSISFQNIQSLDSILGMKTQVLSPVSKSSEEYYNRSWLELRNDPFGTSQIFKNPYHIAPPVNNMLVGHPGISVGGEVMDDYNSMSRNQFVDYMIHYLTLASLKLFRYQGRINYAFTKLRKPLENKSLLSLYSREEMEESKGEIKSFVEKNAGMDQFGIRQKYAATILERWQYNGGYESLSRTRRAFYFYYPAPYDSILTWPQHFVQNRIMLKYILSRKNQASGNLLSTIPDQHGRNKLEFFFRGTGLEYDKWTNMKEFQLFSRLVFKEDNELFTSIFPIKKGLSFLLTTAICPQLVKLKLFCDQLKNGNLLKQEERSIKS